MTKRLTDDEYARLLALQGGGCYICERRPTPGRRLNEDHDHKTGLSRGLLCIYCNRYVVGKFRVEDVKKLQRVVTYLVMPPAQGLFPGRKLAPRKRRRKT